MVRFEKKVRSKLKQDVQEFDVWFDENQEKLSKFKKDNPSKNVVCSHNILKSKSIWMSIGAACVTLILVLLVIFNFGIKNTDNQTIEVPFGEDIIRYRVTSEAEMDILLGKYSFLNKLLIENAVNFHHIEDDTLVATVVNGDIEAENNYYLCHYMFVYNDNFRFGSKEVYNNLNGKIQKDGYVIHYSTEGEPFDGWYLNYLLLEPNEETKVYLRIECMYDDLTFILENIL